MVRLRAPLVVILCALCTAVLLAAAGQAAHADEWIVVLDDGAPAALASTAALRETAARIAAARHAAGADARVLGVATDADGAATVRTLWEGAPEDPAEPPAAGSLAPTAGAGTADVRVALAEALQRARDPEDLLVILLGGFGGGSDAEAPAGFAPWQADHGARRVLGDGLSEVALAFLDEVPVHAPDAILLLELPPPEVSLEAFSPFAQEDAAVPLVATLRARREFLAFGSPADLPLLVLRAIGDADTVTPLETDDPDGQDGPARAWRIERPLAAGLESAARLSVDPDLPLLVASAGAPDVVVPLVWGTLLPEMRLSAPDQSPAQPFEALDAFVGTANEGRYRLVRTRAETRGAVRLEFEPVAGFTATLGPFEQAGPLLEVAELTLRFEPETPGPLDARGTLRLVSEDEAPDLAVDFALRTAPGAVGLVVAGPASGSRLPRAEADAAYTLRVDALNPNAPAEVTLALAGSETVVLRVIDAEGRERTWRAGEPFVAETRRVYGAFPELADLEAWRSLEPGALTVTLVADEAYTTTGEGRIAYEARQPTLVLENLPAAYRVAGNRVVAEQPLRLAVDPDGGDGAFRQMLFAAKPTVTPPWKIETLRPGVFELRGYEDHAGSEPDLFVAQEEALTLSVAWPPGPRDTQVTVTLTQPPRWGVVAYGLIALAALAVLLGLYAFLQFRAPPLRGKLLYTSPRLAGTVGRLDLGGLGRGAAAIRADEKGRLSLGGRGHKADGKHGSGEAIAMVRSSRIGGLLLLPRPGGKPERRLLVDGLSVEAGEHQLRYFSGDGEQDVIAVPTVEAPDLIGSEYDLETGRIEGIELPKTEQVGDASLEAGEVLRTPEEAP